MIPRVLGEWRARIAAEYASAAVTQAFVLWLIQVGAPPDLIDAGLVIVSDELTHSRLSHDVYTAAGGTVPPAIDQHALGLARSSDRIEYDLLTAALRVFCLGETVAVPLFRHLREGCTEPTARTALDRILRDEVRHRDFGWDALDWLLLGPIGSEVAGRARRELPAMFATQRVNYGSPTNRGEALTPAERAWGLAEPREYAEILTRTIANEYTSRFAVRGIDISAFAQ
jgi:hypothetical protein